MQLGALGWDECDHPKERTLGKGGRGEGGSLESHGSRETLGDRGMGGVARPEETGFEPHRDYSWGNRVRFGTSEGHSRTFAPELCEVLPRLFCFLGSAGKCAITEYPIKMRMCQPRCLPTCPWPRWVTRSATGPLAVKFLSSEVCIA